MANDNLMEMKPQRKSNITWEASEKIVLVIERTSKIDRLVQKLFKTPKSNKINLDEMGSFVWSQCDGSRTVYDILELMEKHFGESANHLLDRLIQYVQILVRNKFVTLE